MKTLKTSILSALCVLLAAVALPAQAVLVTDNYEGASGTTECMGASYCIASANVTRAGNVLTVSINTTFAGLAGTTFTGTDQTVGGTGIGYGDLFLASAWTPFGSAPYASDDASNGTLWTYGLAIDSNRFTSGSTGGSATLYKLNTGDNTIDALLSEDFMAAGFNPNNYRNGQEVAVKTTSPADVTNVGAGTWSVVNGSTVSFSIDLTGTDLETTAVAFHWGMTCANDTIEGEIGPPTIIPVPASVWLMGSGLLGLVSIARRRKRA